MLIIEESYSENSLTCRCDQRVSNGEISTRIELVAFFQYRVKFKLLLKIKLQFMLCNSYVASMCMGKYVTVDSSLN